MKNSFNNKDLIGLSGKIIKAVKDGNIGILNHLISIGADVNERDISKTTPLIWAAISGHKEIVEFLIVNGADINARDIYNNNALIFSIACGKPDITKLLIENNIDINTLNKHQENALSLAVGARKKEIVSLLINSGADLNIKNNSKLTPLENARAKGFKDIEKTILDYIKNTANEAKEIKQQALAKKSKLLKQVSDPSLKRKLKIHRPVKFKFTN